MFAKLMSTISDCLTAVMQNLKNPAEDPCAEDEIDYESLHVEMSYYLGYPM